MTTPRFSRYIPFLLAAWFTACSTVPPVAPLPLPPPPETEAVPEAPAARLPQGIRLETEGRELSLAELESGTLPADATITVRAERNVSYDVITEMLNKIHALGYLVQFPTAD